MAVNFRSLYRASEEEAKLAMFALFALLACGFLGTVFFSSSLVFALALALVGIAATFARPEWVMLAFAAYLPFEPFLLKWVPDDIYVYARYASEVVIYLLVTVVLWRVATGTIRLKRTPLDVAFVLLVVAALASTVVNTVSPWIALLGLRQIFRFILLFFIAVYLAPSKQYVRRFMMVMLGVTAIQVGLGMMQAIVGEPLDALLLPSAERTLGDLQLTAGTTQFWDPGQRVFGTMGRYDQLGTFLAFFLVMLVAGLYEGVVKRVYELPSWILLLAGTVTLGLTYSRSSWIGFLLAFLFIGIVLHRDRRVIVASLLVPVLLVGYVSVTGLVVRQLVDTSRQTFIERVFEAFSYTRFTGEYYGLGRVYWIVQTVVTVVPHSPIFGFGPGTYGGGAVAALGNTEVYELLGLPFGVYGTSGYIDNNWFSVWGELGTLGLAAMIALFVILFRVAWQIYRESKDDEVRALAVGVMGVILAVSVNAFLATYLEARTLAPYLWMLAGMLVALGQKEHVV